jgi:hypothetical protein
MSNKAHVLIEVPDARIRKVKTGWIVLSEKYGELNDISFASPKDAWADAWDTVHRSWHKIRLDNKK